MIGKARKYLQDSSEELKKVSWPNRPRVIRLTALVVFVTLGMAIYLGILDSVLFNLVEKIVEK